MPSTRKYDLPLLAAAQAQKHVTVNEALLRLDAAAELRVESAALTEPPGSVEDGAAYLIPRGASGAWSGHPEEVALRLNGGWEFLVPQPGWRLWDVVEGAYRVFDGQTWVLGAVAIGAAGSATVSRVLEIDHILTAGPTSTVSAAIPGGVSVLGVSGRVTTALTGDATAWRLGIAGSEDRYGSGLGLAPNSFVLGLTGQPVAYYSPTDLILTAEGGDFVAGAVRLAVHMSYMLPPRAV